MEACTAYCAAQRALPEDVRKLEKIVTGMEENLASGKPSLELDALFHVTIAHATHNVVWLHLMQSIFDSRGSWISRSCCLNISPSAWDCQACASACPCGVNADELVAEFTCERKGETGLGFLEDLILRGLVPHPDRLENSMVPMRMYQNSGLQKLVRKLGILKMFPRQLERMEGLLPPLPPGRCARKSMK